MKLNRVVIVSIFLVVGLSVFGQSLSGRILERETKNPIPFANVFIPDLGVGVLSDSLGFYAFNNRLPPSVKLRVSAAEKETILITVQTGQLSFDIFLNSKHLELDEVIVSNNQGLMQRSNSTHIETRKLADLNTIPGTNLTDALSNIPGVYGMSTGIGISKPVIRGAQGMRVVTLLNGLRIENQQWGGDHGMGITELGIGTVEVIKGPASLLYGADALGGVLYFVDEPYARQNTHEFTVKTQFETASMGTKNQLMYKVAKKNYRLSLGGLFSDNADFQLPSGQYALNSRFSDRSAKLAFGTNKGRWSMHFRYNFSNTRSGIPGHSHDSIIDPTEFQVDQQSRQATIPVQVFNNHFLSIENKFFFKRHELTFLGGQTFNRLQEFEEKFTIPELSADLHNSLYSVKLKSQITEEFSIVSGFQGMVQYNVNSSIAEERLIPNALTFDNGVFAIAYFEKRDWNLQAGIRYDVRSIKSLESFKDLDPIHRSYQGFNYSLGAVRTVEKQTLRMNVSSGFRAPHLSELLANGFHHGALRYEIGSIELRSEKATQLDLTYEIHGDHVEIIINPFGSILENYIYLEPMDTMISSLPVYSYVQLKNAYSYGSDIGWHYHPHFAHWLHLENSVSYVMIKGTEGFNVSLLPQTRISTLLKFAIPMKTKFRIHEVSMQHMYFFKQNTVATYESVSAAYQVINVGVNGELKGKVPLEFSLGVKNLLNARYIDHLSRLKNIDLPFPGRNAYVSLVYHVAIGQKSK